jgi:hypothetical protein
MTASPIRDASGKLAITPGDWWYQRDHGAVMSTLDGKLVIVCDLQISSNCRADGNLIAVAGTITNQTGRTPAELAALVRELRGVLEDVRSLPLADTYPDGPCIQSYLMDDVIAALAKSEGV